MRATLNSRKARNFRCTTPKEERAFGIKAARAFKAKYGALPSVINGKSPLMDAAGAARATNVYTEAQCRELIDDEIRAFFAKTCSGANLI